MAQYLIGNFLGDPDANMFVFPANGVITNKNKLVMGAGAAEALKDYKWFDGDGAVRFYNIDGFLADVIMLYPLRKARGGLDYYEYGFTGVRCSGDVIVAALQTKGSWNRPSKLSMVDSSLERMAEWNFDSYIISMAYPGVGKGKLDKKNVQPLIEKHLGFLGDRLRVYDLEEK